MATKVSTKADEVVEVVAEDKSKADYDELKSQFDALKKMLMENMATTAKVAKEAADKVKEAADKVKETTKEVVEDTEDSEDEFENMGTSIDPNCMINVTNMYYGELLLQGINKVIDFPAFGVTLPMTYGDIAHAQSQARSFAEDGHFYIHNKKAVKTLYLEDAYENFIKKDKLVGIYSLSQKQIKDMILHTTDGIKKTIADMTIATLISDEKKDYEHKKIKDNSKISYIGELLGVDLVKESKKISDI
jgi:ElaB/YqjD/DUF883 family membrane-anchored ribosome-binding protein